VSEHDTPATRKQLSIAIGIFRLLPRGGLEDHCMRIAEELVRRGHDVTLFATGDLPETTVRAHRLERRGRSNHQRMAEFGRAFARASGAGFDRRVAFQPVGGVDLVVLADPVRGRRDAPVWKRLTPRFRTYAALERACFDPAGRTRIIGLSEPQMRDLAASYGVPADRIAVLPPTVSPDFGDPTLRSDEQRRSIRREFGIPDCRSLWLWAGLQPRVKGLDRVIDALARFPGARLLIAGLKDDDTKLLPFLRRAARLGVRDRIHPLGFAPRGAMMRALAAADVLAHPARQDVTGTVILEAVVKGTPVVSTAVCGYSTHVARSGAGRVLAEPFDAAAFDAALAEVCGPSNGLFSDKGIAYGRNPALFSGIGCAAALIEAPLDRPWPVEANGAKLDV
jgi:UDP-glucose:(heptosyl)LPS alpha-1,3-glucosyltransferase